MRVCVCVTRNATGMYSVIGAMTWGGAERIVVNVCHSCELSGNNAVLRNRKNSRVWRPGKFLKWKWKKEVKVKGIRMVAFLGFLGWGWVTDPETKKSLVVRCQCPSQGQANMPPLSCEDTPPPPLRCLPLCWFNPSLSTISCLQQMTVRTSTLVLL